MSVDLVAAERWGNLSDPSYELLLRRGDGVAFLRLTSCYSIGTRLIRVLFVGVTELGRTVNARLDATGGKRLADGDVLAIDRAGAVPVVVVVRLRSAEVYLVEVDRMDPIALAHACWEIGNMHAPLFRGDSDEHTVRMYTPGAACFGPHAPGVSRVFGSRWSHASSMPVDALHRARRMLL